MKLRTSNVRVGCCSFQLLGQPSPACWLQACVMTLHMLTIACLPVQHHRACADEKVSSALKTQIVQARTAKKMTQAQLAQVRSMGVWGVRLETVGCVCVIRMA
jgi:hypothetical protein